MSALLDAMDDNVCQSKLGVLFPNFKDHCTLITITRGLERK